MIYDKKSIDYQINMEAFREMEEVVPMTVSERRATRKWVQRGHELESNPWNYYDTDGLPLNYLQAHRLHHVTPVVPGTTGKVRKPNFYVPMT